MGLTSISSSISISRATSWGGSAIKDTRARRGVLATGPLSGNKGSGGRTHALPGGNAANFQETKEDAPFVALLDEIVGLKQENVGDAHLAAPGEESLECAGKIAQA